MKARPGQLDELPIIYRGCDWDAIFINWKDENGDPIDIRGYTPFAQLVTGESLNPIKTDPINGVTAILMYKAQTTLLRLGYVDWDWVWQRNSDGFRYPPHLWGRILVAEPKTHNFT